MASAKDVLDNANMSREAAVDLFKAQTEKAAEDQAVYFLNANWDVSLSTGKTGQEEAEAIWTAHQLWTDVLKEHPEEKEGKSFNEVNSRQFLEKAGIALTALKFRTAFKELDIDGDKEMAFMEFLQYKFADATTEAIVDLVKRPQATSPEMEAAKKAVLEVQAQQDAIKAERAKLEEAAAGEGVKAKAAANQLAQFDLQDHKEVNMAESRAERALQKAAKNVGDAPAGIWWMQRGVEEAAKYKPKPKE
jgi:hypothetical protein